MTRQQPHPSYERNEPLPADWYGGARPRRSGRPSRDVEDEGDDGDRYGWRGSDELTGEQYERSGREREERGWRDEPRGNAQRGERGDGRERERHGDGGWSRSGRGEREPWRASGRERSRWDEREMRERDDGRGRPSRASLDERRDEDNDPRPYYAGTYRRSAQPYSFAGGRGMFVAESMTLSGPYTGKGPKGYRRSPERLKEEVSERLERDGSIDASEIEVECQGAIVTLKGTVPDRATKRRAEDCVEDVYGVDDVMNQLKVDAHAFESGSRESSRKEDRKAGEKRG